MHDAGPRFNAIDDGWMAGVGHPGRVRRIGIAEALRDGAGLLTVGGPPTVAVAALRLLTAVAGDALREVGRHWSEFWEAGVLPQEPVDRYLEEHRDRFELFHPDTPFLQDATMRGDATALKSVAELVPFVPTGAGAVLYDRHTGLGGANPLRLEAAEACAWLVAAQQFCVSGMCGRRKPADAADEADSGPAPGRAGPLVDRVLAVPTGGSLARTILLGIADAAPGAHGEDRPPWRRDEAVIPGPATGSVAYLTWMTRHVLLLPEHDGTVVRLKIAVDPAVDPRLDRSQMAALDPHLMMREAHGQQDGWRVENYRPRQAVWRATPTLIAASARRAGALATARGFDGREIGLEMFGFAVESHSKPIDHIRSRLPVPMTACPDALAEAAAVAQAVESVLVACAYGFASGLGLPPIGADSGVVREYHERLGASAGTLFAGLARTPDAAPRLIADWRDRCAEAARAALTAFTSGIAPGAASLSGRFRALRRLDAALAKGATDREPMAA